MNTIHATLREWAQEQLIPGTNKQIFLVGFLHSNTSQVHRTSSSLLAAAVEFAALADSVYSILKS